jgi:hypothetical protein
MPLSEAEELALDGATCPNWAWTEANPNPDTANAMNLLAYPRPLPPVYLHGGYRTSPELADRRRRMLHIFTCILTAGLGAHMIFNMDHTQKDGRPHVFTPLHNWATRMKGELFSDPAEAYHREKAARAALEQQREAQMMR